MRHLLHYLPSACPKLPKKCLGLGSSSPRLPCVWWFSVRAHLALAREISWARKAPAYGRPFSAWNVLCVGESF